jgi:hypothetical protein
VLAIHGLLFSRNGLLQGRHFEMQHSKLMPLEISLFVANKLKNVNMIAQSMHICQRPGLSGL